MRKTAHATIELTLKKCGSSQLSYPASMRPATSCKRMMANLQNHFGDD